MTVNKVLEKVKIELDKKFLNRKKPRFINYNNIKRKVIKELKKKLNYIVVKVFEEVEIIVLDLINNDKTVIYINFIDHVFDNELKIYYEFFGDNNI